MEGFPMGGGGCAAVLATGWGCCHGGRLPVAGVEVVVVSVQKANKTIKQTNTSLKNTALMVFTYSAAMAVGHWLSYCWWVEGVGPAVAKVAEAQMAVGVAGC